MAVLAVSRSLVRRFSRKPSPNADCGACSAAGPFGFGVLDHGPFASVGIGYQCREGAAARSGGILSPSGSLTFVHVPASG
jgi:hypothetical protein